MLVGRSCFPSHFDPHSPYRPSLAPTSRFLCVGHLRSSPPSLVDDPPSPLRALLVASTAWLSDRCCVSSSRLLPSHHDALTVVSRGTLFHSSPGGERRGAPVPSSSVRCARHRYGCGNVDGYLALSEGETVARVHAIGRLGGRTKPSRPSLHRRGLRHARHTRGYALGRFHARGSESVVPSPKGLLGVPLQRSTPLPVRELQYPWTRFARVGITVGELLATPSLRPDLAWIRKISEVGLADQSELALSRLLAEGDGVAYQIPDEIAGDRTFTFRIDEERYVGQMAAYLAGADPDPSVRFILSEVPGLYVYPRPFAYTKPRVALQKSAASLMRIHGIAVAHWD